MDTDSGSDSDCSVGTRKKIVDEILLSVPLYIQKVECDTNRRTVPFKCAVSSCSNIYVSYEDHATRSYKFHNFPILDPVLCKQWRRLCNLPENCDVSNIKVCSTHFSLDDYQRNYREEFANPNFKRRLTHNALPSLYLSGNPVQVVLPDVPKPPINEVKPVVDEIEQLENRKNEMMKQIDDMNEKIKCAQTKTALKMKEVVKMRGIYRRLTGNNHHVGKQEKNLVSKVFSDSQVKLLMGKRKVVWNDDDLAKAFTMRHMGGKECYLYLKNTLKLPLPALSCVQKWVASNKSAK